LLIVPRLDAGDSATLLFRRAFQINPFIEIHAPQVYELPVFWRGTLQLGLRHYHDGDFARALEDFGSVIRRTQKAGHPEATPPVALWYHILSAAQLGRYDDAISDGQVLLDAAQRSDEKGQVAGNRRAGDIEYMLADLHRAAGHASEARDLYELVSQNDLSFYMAHVRLAEIYQAQGQWDHAILERHRAIDANPDDPSLVFDLGVTLADAGHDSEAESALQQASQANPRETRATYTLGVVESRLGRAEDARAAFKQFLALAPSRYMSMRDDAAERLASLH
jgi:Flp pilus assembly protein TadD